MGSKRPSKDESKDNISNTSIKDKGSRRNSDERVTSSRRPSNDDSEDNVSTTSSVKYIEPPRSSNEQERRASQGDSEDTISPSKEVSKDTISITSSMKQKGSRRNSGEQAPEQPRMSSRMRKTMERVEMLARPNARRLRSLWDEKCAILPKERRDRIKSALEEDYFLSPEQTEQYFQALAEHSHRWSGPGGMVSRKEQMEREKEFRQRQRWLVNFSAQVAYRLCDYIAKGQKELLVSNRLRSIADVVLERVAEILGEPKPSRTHPGRLARFMVAISDRIAVWIENAVYRADAFEPKESGKDEHIRLDSEKPLICT